jgi:ABC-type multidrug transport system fused ATPase/permease subunit
MDPAVEPVDGDPEMTDSSFMVATLVLVLPFVLIPSSIIITRLAKYLWKVYQAKKYGYGGDILDDPLAELGLKIRRGYENTADIRKIRKEKRKREKETIKRRESDARRAKLNEQMLQNRPGEPETRPVFQIPDFVPLHAAEQYLDELRKKTARTWYEKLSPDAVRKWFNISLYARLWMILQVTCTALAIGNYVALTYLASRADRDERTLIKNLDIFYATVFMADYFLSFYIAEDRLLFYLNPMSLIDLLSIVTPFVYLFVASPTKYVWFIGFVRIFRATRILRTYRLLSFTQSEQSRELTLFVLNFLNFVFFSGR